MEFIGQPRPSGACNLLGVPVISSWDVDDDEGEVVINIRPKSSPLPRRKSSVSDEDSEPEPPMCGSRRVSFADAKGLNLVQVKEFDMWDVPKLPGYDSSDGEGKVEDEYVLSPLNFSLPLLTEELFAKVQEQKVELEKIYLLPGTTILKGMVRVLNISFTKAVYVRTSLDDWSSHFDLLAEYIPCSTDGLTDCFSFTLTLWPPFGAEGARVDFCLRYETPVGTFWANNNNKNYVLSCFRRTKEKKEKPKKENVNKKSCLKTASQNSSVENVSVKESPTQGIVSAGLEVGTLKSKNDQSGTSEEQKLLIESRMNGSQRSRRKAARMARVRDYFAQRNGGANNTDRDESPPEVTPAAQEESQKEEHADVQLYSDRNRKSEGSQFVAESQVTCSEPPLNVSRVMSPAHDCASKSEPEKSDSFTSAASAALAEGESAAGIQDNLFEKFAQAEQKHTKCQASSQDRDMGHEYISCTAAVSNESLVSQTSNFTFETVLAPLYHQVFGRVGSESQSRGDWGNPAWVTRHGGDLNPHADRRQISCTVSTDIRSNNSKVQGNGINNPTTPSNPHAEEDKEEGASLGVIVNVVTLQDPAGTETADQGCTNTLQGSKPCLEDTLSHPESLNILLQTDLLNPQITAESLHLQGEAQEDSVTHDLQSQITAETMQCRLPESARTHNKKDPDETHAQSNTHKVWISPQTSFASLESSQGAMGRVIEEPDREDSSREEKHHECVELIKDHFPGNTTLKEDELFEDLRDLYSYHIEDSVTKATVSGCELVEKSDLTTPETFLEARGETANMEERSKMAQSSLKDESKPSGEIEVPGELAECVAKETPEKIEHCEIKADEEGFCLGDITEVKNWEMMVEEEEKNMLIYEEKSETVYLKPHDTEVRGKEIALKTNEEFVEEITVTGANEDKEWTRQENLGETVGGEDGASTERQYAEVIKMDRIGGEDELTEETEVQKTEGPEETGLQKEKHFAGKEVTTQEVSNERARDQEEEETKGEGKTEINFNNGGAEWEKKPKEGQGEEQKTDCKEEILNCEAEEAEIVGADACMAKEEKKDKVLHFEERLDMTQSRDEHILSALVSSGQECGSERGFEKENTGEGQNAHIQTESHHYKVEGFQSRKDATQDQSQDENEPIAAERDTLTDEAESDQTSHDSASAESDSDDEVELYMHCLRAVGAGARSHKDKGKGFTVSKRPCVSRAKLLSATMPSISESQDEEQHLSRLQEKHEDPKTAAVVSPSASSGRERIGQNVLLWRDKFSCSHITKSLLYATLLVVFVVVAYHFDFLACLGLYLISVVWLCCREEKQPIKNNTEG